MRGRFVLGYAAVGATGPNYPLDFAAILGSTGGEQSHQLTLDELPAHNHGNTGNVNGSNAGTTGNYPSLFTGVSGAHNHGALTGLTGQHSHTSNANGGNGTVQNPAYSLSTYTGNNTMNATVNNGNEPDLYASSVALVINSAGDHAHSIAIDGSHDHSVTLRSVGENVPHNTMPPFYVLIYIMKIY